MRWRAAWMFANVTMIVEERNPSHISAQAFHVSAIRCQSDKPVTANLLRGAFGASLRAISLEGYQWYFAPENTGSGPSGYRDSPRPFVFRLNQPGLVQMNVFTSAQNALDLFCEALMGVRFLRSEACSIEQLCLPLAPGAAASNIRVSFVTATELKGADEPQFGVLFARMRDRISTLRALWGEGPLEIDFRELGQRAEAIQMSRCELRRHEDRRTSKNTGQRHPLSGFMGTAEYHGNLGEFLPYLEIARYTGVGRQTVWGKGEIGYETF